MQLRADPHGDGRSALALTFGLVGILVFAAALWAVTWFPARLDILLAMAMTGLLCLVVGLALGQSR